MSAQNGSWGPQSYVRGPLVANSTIIFWGSQKGKRLYPALGSPYLVFVEADGLLEHSPDHVLRAVWRGEGAIVAKIDLELVLLGEQVPQAQFHCGIGACHGDKEDTVEVGVQAEPPWGALGPHTLPLRKKLPDHSHPLCVALTRGGNIRQNIHQEIEALIHCGSLLEWEGRGL